MSISNFVLNFDSQVSHTRPIRPQSDKWYNSPFGQRMRFEVSEGIRPAEYFAVDKYAPVCLKDKTLEDYIVLPKGRIVSSVSINGLDTTASFKNAITGAITTDTLDGAFGYDSGINSQLVLANGGTAADLFYTTEDVAAATFKSAIAYAAAGDAYSRAANVPVGVVFHDWYQDLAGKYLNYKRWADGGHVLTKWFVEVPYLVETNTAANNPQYTAAGDAAADLVEWNLKYVMNKKFTYLSLPYNVAPATSANGAIGSLVQSDLIGNYKIQSSSVTAAKTVQTVGKIIAVDYRFPKGGLEDVQTYPGSGASGTQTAGIPAFLFDFAVAAETLAGNVPTIESVLAAVKTGKYGIARIALSI